VICSCAECASDRVCRVILERYWSPEVWLSRVGTPEERSNRFAPVPADPEPRGELRLTTGAVRTTEIHGEIDG
jgi:hypothetical protein